MRAARTLAAALALTVLVSTTASAAVRPAPQKSPPPGTRTYVVRAGDNLETIAKRFGTTVKAIAAANRIRNFNLIVIGTKLTIPGPSTAGGATASSAKAPAKLKARPERLALAPRFDYWARQYGLPTDLLKGLAWYESGWQNGIVSSTGAVGVGQLMPYTSEFVANQLLKNPALDPKRVDDNIRMSARFLRFLLDKTGGDHVKAVASYYQGLARTQRGTMLEETKRYVEGVAASRKLF